MKTLTQFFNPFLNECQMDAKYEVIENMIVSAKDFKGLSISGSLFSLTTFKDVTFESCVFYGSKIENCKFVNCKFQFTNISHCKFSGTRLDNCKWDYSPIKRTEFNFSYLCSATMHFSSLESNNSHSSCTSNADLTWEQALAAEEAVSKSTQQEQENFTSLVENFLFGKQAA